MTTQQSKWNADAEMSMMGFVVPVESNEHLNHMIGYVLFTMSGAYHYDIEAKTKEVYNNALNKYNSSKDKSIKYFTVNKSMFGVLMTFVRDKSKLTKKDGSPTSMGSYAWVENLDAPDCSELGCVFFECKNGKTRRIS